MATDPEIIKKLTEDLDNLNDIIDDISKQISTNLNKQLAATSQSITDIVEGLEKGEDVTKKTAAALRKAQLENRNLGLEQNRLQTQLLDIEKQLTKKYSTKLKAQKDSITTQIQDNLLQQQLNEAVIDYLRNVSAIAQKEKEITEEKKKQNNLGEVLKKKFAEQYKTLKEIFTLGSIVDMLFKGSENIANFRKELGISYENAYVLNTQLGFVGNNVFDAYINGEKLKKSFTDLSKEMGFIVSYGNESLVTMTNLTGKLGMSNKEAAQLTTLSRMQSKDTENILDNVGKTVTAMNKQGNTAILLKDVMKEIANVSKATAVSLGSNPIKIAEAVTAAKQLGTTLQQMESTADSLLNFQSSIQNELEAELLTGKQMNLERARAAALANDMKTLAEEIGKNEEVINAFASGNRLSQEATAKALGMNREQLAAMVYQQEAMKIGAEGVRAKYGEQAYEQLKAQNAQEKFNNTVEKLKSALSSVVQIFSPIIDLLATISEFVASIVSQWYILYPLLAGAALVYLPKIASSFANVGKSIMGMASNFTKLFSKGGITSLMGGETSKTDIVDDKKLNNLDQKSTKVVSIGKKIGDFGKGIGDFIKGISAGVGKAIENILTGIGKGLKSVGTSLSNPKIILGLAAFTGVMIGLGYALNLAAPAIKAIGEAIGTVITSIANGISTVVGAIGDMIVKLGEVGPALLLLGPALFGIAGGLVAMGFAGLLATPVLLALTALGAVAPALSAIGIGGEEKENINPAMDLTPMIAAINEVRDAVNRLYNKDTTVKVDSKVVATEASKKSYKSR